MLKARQNRCYSLESLGVNVAHLCKKAFDLDLEWASDGLAPGHVCTAGVYSLTLTHPMNKHTRKSCLAR